ncbi:MAG: hypothetical protein BV457_00095 [Thermoplasmata archaeon M9B1D]|nr:MAG: hypothetical protein BV457_00095 [Thermoplasmata archaeon M9B1D]PNX52235.1 MAG: hypothetical protein BV456_00200 [Thermoplasmata archaeon M8B2D]
MNENKFIKKSITKILLQNVKGQLVTKPNLEDNLKAIGFWVGKIAGFGEKAKDGYTQKEVLDLMDKLNEGFIEGYSTLEKN